MHISLSEYVLMPSELNLPLGVYINTVNRSCFSVSSLTGAVPVETAGGAVATERKREKRDKRVEM